MKKFDEMALMTELRRLHSCNDREIEFIVESLDNLLYGYISGYDTGSCMSEEDKSSYYVCYSLKKAFQRSLQKE